MAALGTCMKVKCALDYHARQSPMRRTTDLPAPTRTAPRSAGLKLGDRVRQLRMSAGMTQTDLAGDRFSKEYVSQIERGKTRPTQEAIQGIAAPELELRALGGEAWARMQEGQLHEAGELLDRARQLTENPSFSDVDRADVLFRLGVCRYKLQSISTAVGLFNEALTLADRSGMPCDLLRSNILGWRSRCYRRQRDYEAA